VDPLSIVQVIDIAVRRCEELARACKNFRKNPERVEELAVRYVHLRKLIQRNTVPTARVPSDWQDSLALAEEYFRKAATKLTSICQKLMRRRRLALSFIMANPIAETVAVLTAGLERLEIKLLVIDGFCRIFVGVCQELGPESRVKIIEDSAVDEAARGVFLVEFDRLPVVASSDDLSEAEGMGLDAEDSDVDDEEVEGVLHRLDTSVSNVKDFIRSQCALPAPLRTGVEKVVERLWERWTVHPEQIQFSSTAAYAHGESEQKEIGRSATGTIYEGSFVVSRNEGENVQHLGLAVKVLPNLLMHKALKADFLREMELLSELRHPCIVHFHGAFWPKRNDEQETAYVLTELMSKSLGSWRRDGFLTLTSDILKILTQVAAGIEYLHENGIAHMDLKPENVLLMLDNEGHVLGCAKITDFGVSQKKRRTTSISRKASAAADGGTLMYMAPERLVGATKARPACDAWSYGVMLCYLLLPTTEAGKVFAMTDLSVIDAVESAQIGNIFSTLSSKIADTLLRELAVSCLSLRPERRPAFCRIRLTVAAASLDLNNEWVRRMDGRDADCMYGIGLQYFFGVGRVKDRLEAWTWLKMAGLFGNSDAEYMIRLCFEASSRISREDLDIEQSISSVLDTPDVRSWFLLGCILEYGSDSIQNRSKAVKMYESAVDAGHKCALVNLGHCYQKGCGVRKDVSKAVMLYRKAANSGCAAALTSLGYCHQYGIGLPQNISEAVQMYRQAADAGREKAQTHLGFCYQNGIGVRQDGPRAASLYQHAADAGSAQAQFNLGTCYQHGTAVRKDVRVAQALYRQAAKAGNIAADRKVRELELFMPQNGS
jgi:TPR repeat protein